MGQICHAQVHTGKLCAVQVCMHKVDGFGPGIPEHLLQLLDTADLAV